MELHTNHSDTSADSAIWPKSIFGFFFLAGILLIHLHLVHCQKAPQQTHEFKTFKKIEKNSKEKLEKKTRKQSISGRVRAVSKRRPKHTHNFGAIARMKAPENTYSSLKSSRSGNLAGLWFRLCAVDRNLPGTQRLHWRNSGETLLSPTSTRMRFFTWLNSVQGEFNFLNFVSEFSHRFRSGSELVPNIFVYH